MGKVGKQSIQFDNDVWIRSAASVVGQKEGEGPISKYFDEICKDPMFGQDSWEKAESMLQTKTVNKLLEKSSIDIEKIRYLYGGDLLGQLMASTFGIAEFNIPFFGLYGACSTMGEGMGLASMAVDGGYADNVIALASSHYASAEKTFRFPLEYAKQRPQSASWTVTGCGALLIGRERGIARITGITTGKIVDYGIKDSQNMGACMAPAAADTILNHMKDFGSTPDDFDKIITGDLGMVGQKILIDILKDKGIDISAKHMDCGIEIFDANTQDTHAGGSGCGCSASVLAGMILDKMMNKKYKRILFIPTGALTSQVSFNEGQTVPGIAHLVRIEV